jgi:hypothetical protein
MGQYESGSGRPLDLDGGLCRIKDLVLVIGLDDPEPSLVEKHE